MVCTTSFKIPKLYILLAECIYVFCMYCLRTKSIKRLVFIAEMASVYCAVRPWSLNKGLMLSF